MSKIPRGLAVEYGREAVAISLEGRYVTPSGKTIVIAESVAAARAGTVSYPPDRPTPWERENGATPDIPSLVAVENATTLAAARRLLDEGHDAAALNFASATSPGGGFLSGARAQEEYLARSSALYTCLRGNPMYSFHQQREDPLYTDYVIYSPRVPVFRADSGALLEDPYTVGIITSPAVNAVRLPRERFGEIAGAMRKRIHKVLAVGLLHGHDAIVLGAWGCGAFGNDGNQIASVFREQIHGEFRGAYRRVVFAITDWSDDERFIGPFRTAFEHEGRS